MLLRKASSIGGHGRLEAYFDADGGDVVEAHEWRCVRTTNGKYYFFQFSSLYLSIICINSIIFHAELL